MSDQQGATPEADVEDSATELDDAQTANDTDDGDTDDGDKPLGPKGEKALTAEKERRKRTEAELREWRKLGLTRDQIGELVAAQRKADGDVTDPEEIRAKTRAEVEAELRLQHSRDRVLDKIEAKAGKLFADPDDAAALVLRGRDVEDFLDGDTIDGDAIEEALGTLLKRKPYLAAQSSRRFQGSADGGARNGRSKAAQLSRNDLKGMSPEQIVAAKADGRLDDLLGT